MRSQGHGRIVNVSSIAGDMYSPLGGWYYVSKHALNVWSDTLDSEIQPFGLRSVVIEPGSTKSNWLAIAMQKAADNLRPDSPYQGIATVGRRVMEDGGRMTHATSMDLAHVFYRAATARRPKSRYFYSFADRAMTAFTRMYPGLYRSGLDLIIKLGLKEGKKAEAKGQQAAEKE